MYRDTGGGGSWVRPRPVALRGPQAVRVHSRLSCVVCGRGGRESCLCVCGVYGGQGCGGVVHISTWNSLFKEERREEECALFFTVLQMSTPPGTPTFRGRRRARRPPWATPTFVGARLHLSRRAGAAGGRVETASSCALGFGDQAPARCTEAARCWTTAARPRALFPTIT